MSTLQQIIMAVITGGGAVKLVDWILGRSERRQASRKNLYEEIDRLWAKNELQDKKLDEQEARHAEEIKALKAAHAEEIDKLKAAHTAEVAGLQAQIDRLRAIQNADTGGERWQ